MPKILVIDDRPTNREFLVTLLSYGGNELLEASDGAQGLALAKARRPDLVIADIIMPTMDGYEFVRLLRAEPSIAGTSVMFYTASYLEEEARKLAEACGVTRVLFKPADPEEILSAVQEALGARPAEPSPVVAENFDREHLHLVTNKLSEKVDELETLNAELEARVAARTAELTVANEELRSLDRMKDEFLAIVSHDLRSPLCGIGLAAEQIARCGDGMTEARRNELLAMIGTAIRRQVELVNDLLELASNEAGRPRLALAEIHLSEVVRECAQAAGVACAEKQLTMKLAIDDRERPVNADHLKLTRVVNNLLTNAIKFTPTGGRITVSLTREKSEVCLRVADSGTGIDPARLPQLFEKFKIDHERGTAGEQGSGLGLGIVRQLVELHGGRVAVVSEVGRGSTFSIHLPHCANDTSLPPVRERRRRPQKQAATAAR